MRKHNRAAEYRFRYFASRVFAVILAFAIVADLFVFIPLAQRYLGLDSVSANPNKCPQGVKCKWVQHENTGNCQYLPTQAVAGPWKVIPENSCPSLATATLPIPPAIKTVIVEPTLAVLTSTPTPLSVPTEVKIPLPIETCTPTAKLDTKSTAEKVETKATVRTVTATPVCDVCEQLRRMADIMSARATMESK